MYLSTALVFALAMPVFAPIPKANKKIDSFDALVARIGVIAKGDEWRKEGWKDEELAEGLGLLFEDVRKATKNEKWTPPLTLNESTAGDPNMPAGKLKSFLFLKGSSRQTAITRSTIIFVDGSIQMGIVEDSIIIARGVVQTSRCTRSVIVAGHHIQASSDMDAKQPQPALGSGSVMFSGGSLGMLTARGSILYAGKEMQVTTPTAMTVLNPPAKANYAKAGVTEIKDLKLTMAPTAKPNPLEGKLKVVEAIPYRVNTQGGVIVEMGGIERVLRPGKEITGNDGKPIKELEGWSLGQVTTDGKLAIFSKGDEDAPFLLKVPGASTVAPLANGGIQLQLRPLLRAVPVPVPPMKP